MTTRLRTCWVVAIVCAAPASAQERVDSSISPAQRHQMEMRTCKAWHAQPIARLKAEVFGSNGVVDVSIDCAVHGQFQGHPLRSLAHCEGANEEWKCDDAGVEMNLGADVEPRLIRMVDVSPEKALEVHAFIEEQARTGKRIRSSLLDGYLTLVGLSDRNYYSATFDFGDHATTLEIHATCGERGCRYRLGDIQTYATFRDL